MPNQLNALYYAKRASAGLIISEATQISPEGQGYISTPGIHSAEQIEGWKCVTKAVYVAGGHIVLQLWHVGRISHPSFQPGGAAPVAPSAIRPKGQAFTEKGVEPIPTPRALETAEIPAIVEQYAQAARNALAAGFDGVEGHAANGYLIDQFLRDQTNKRTDRYGGSIENRSRFLMEVVDAVSAAVGAERTGVQASGDRRGACFFLPGLSISFSRSLSPAADRFCFSRKSANSYEVPQASQRHAFGGLLRARQSEAAAGCSRGNPKPRVMARHGRDDQKLLPRLGSPAVKLLFKMEELAKRPLPGHLLDDRNDFAVNGRRGEIERGLVVTPRQSLENFRRGSQFPPRGGIG